MNIIHIIKVKQDHHGDIRPVNYDHCPAFKENGIKCSCVESNTEVFCHGIIRSFSLMKQCNKDTYMLECRYCYEEGK